MTIAQEIERILRTNLNIADLTIINESHLHAGHAGDNGSGESHFRVVIASDSFIGLSRVAQHQKIYALLADLLKTSIHALAIESSIPNALQSKSDI